MARDVLTINETVARSQAEGIPVTAYALRTWIRTGELPARKVGSKNLIFWPNLVAFLSCADTTSSSPPAQTETAKIRRVGG